jgi:hypothetical protein
MWNLPEAAKRRCFRPGLSATPFGAEFPPDSSDTISFSSAREFSASLVKTTDFLFFVTSGTSSANERFELPRLSTLKRWSGTNSVGRGFARRREATTPTMGPEAARTRFCIAGQLGNHRFQLRCGLASQFVQDNSGPFPRHEIPPGGDIDRLRTDFRRLVFARGREATTPRGWREATRTRCCIADQLGNHRFQPRCRLASQFIQNDGDPFPHHEIPPMSKLVG